MDASRNAIPLYEQAIELDSNFLLAYIGLARTLSTGGLVWGIFDQGEAWKKATSLYQKARNIDATNIELLDSYYSYLFYYEWDFDEVEKYSKSERSENSEITGIDTDYLIKTGRYTRALDEIEKDIRDDPSRGVLYFFKAQILYFLGRQHEALGLLGEKDPLYDDQWWYIREIARLYLYLNQHEKFKENTTKLLEDFPDRPPLVHWLAATKLLLDSKHEEAEVHLAQLFDLYNSKASGSPAWFIAKYYSAIEEYDMALEWLQKSFDRHEVEMTWLRAEPLLGPLRNHPIYRELYHETGFDKVAPILSSVPVDFLQN